jgi:hypothetical protein
MNIQTSELKRQKVLKDAEKGEPKEKKEKVIEPERRYHPRLDGMFTEEEAKKEIELRAKK